MPPVGNNIKLPPAFARPSIQKGYWKLQNLQNLNLWDNFRMVWIEMAFCHDQNVTEQNNYFVMYERAIR